jgi:hypothetical protein
MIRPDLRIRRLEQRLHRAFSTAAHRTAAAQAAVARRRTAGPVRTRKEGSQ